MTTPAAGNEPSDAMLRRVQLLLAKAADDAATPEESEIYTAKAQELMIKYGIEQAMLNAARPAGQRERVESKRIEIPAPYGLDKASLLYRIAKALGCKTIRYTGRNLRKVTVVVVYGFPSDLAQVEMLFASLTLQATRDMLHAEVPYWDNTAAFRRTFLSGFTSVVAHRLEQMHDRSVREADTATPGTALVLVDRKTEVEQAYNLAHPDARTGRGRNLSGSGENAGRASGRRADLGGQRVGGSRTALGR